MSIRAENQRSAIVVAVIVGGAKQDVENKQWGIFGVQRKMRKTGSGMYLGEANRFRASGVGIR